MKKSGLFFKNIARYLTVLLCLGLFSIPSQAANLSDVVKSIDTFQEKTMGMLDAFKSLYMNYLFEVDPSAPPAMVGNAVLSATTPTINSKLNELAIPDVKEALTQTDRERRLIRLTNIAASDSQQPKESPTAAMYGKKAETDVKNGDLNFNSDSLLLPIAYDSDETRMNAARFIQFVASAVDPLTDINISTLTEAQKKQLNDSPIGREYKLHLRSLVAARSVALNNLLNIYVERLPITDLGKQAGLPDKQVDASPLEVQHYLATRRVNSSEWYKDMSVAPPATLARETVFLLAEMNRQLYQLHEDNQRMLLTLSIMQLQDIQANKVVDKAKEERAKKLLGL